MHIDRIAIIWSVNPINYGLLGSPMAHAGYLESYHSVIWTLDFPDADLDQFKFPMSGYLYSTDVQSVKFRSRIIDMRMGIPEDFKDAIPPWRTQDKHKKDLNDYVTILIDQLEEIHPWRNLDDFVKLDGTPVKAPPRSKFTRVKDPLY